MPLADPQDNEIILYQPDSSVKLEVRLENETVAQPPAHRNTLSLGIPPNVVMKWTGHGDYKAMKSYIDIADSIKVNAMSRFD